MTSRTIALSLFSLVAATATASAQSLSCPSVSGDTTFSTTGLQADCGGATNVCTTKAGVSYDNTGGVLQLPASAGNFQLPPSPAVDDQVYFAAVGDFDGDGWEDFAAATDQDKIYIMRNQTITCGTSGCTGNSSTAVMPSSFRYGILATTPAKVPRSSSRTFELERRVKPRTCIS